MNSSAPLDDEGLDLVMLVEGFQTARRKDGPRGRLGASTAAQGAPRVWNRVDASRKPSTSSKVPTFE
ncbi:hypothetical protein D9611_012326 [Ephemerocybe angulata]|uniref:Uncharacterized protein n=1 Tax=Ephemerocybe angulata TaxID=980116 RepID=A0A8H5AT78_9AGAR|nr:hypothetical protein D9611_012326 [Tulosesus angulatus]